jgi:uncharacterized membrane protein YqaE (UPF0057 family)
LNDDDADSTDMVMIVFAIVFTPLMVFLTRWFWWAGFTEIMAVYGDVTPFIALLYGLMFLLWLVSVSWVWRMFK